MGSLGGISPGGSIALGILVGLLSTSIQSLGLTLQRKSHILEDEKGPHDVRRPPHRRRRWQIGMAMFIAANIFGSTVQISTLPLPVLSTLQASGLVFNSICATLILAEPFTTWSLWGTVLVCTGAALIAVFGAIPAPAHTLQELLDLLGKRGFVAWMICTGVVVVAIAASTDIINNFSTLSKSSRFRLIRGLSYGCISGVLSAHCLLVAKSAVELVIKTISDGSNQFAHWQSWMILLALIALALTQLYYLHRGLKLVSTSVLYPLVFCIYNIIAILDGLIYFRQTDLITTLDACLISLGTVILLAGVLALSWRLSDEQHTPGVGQSSLAPGLGLVEDTEGEDESLLGDNSADEEAASGYQTFAPHNGDRPLSLASRKSFRLNERDEIWGELDDRDEIGPVLSRNRATSFPVLSESSSLLPRRSTSGAGPSEGEASLEATGRRVFRKRRKSTGFPGFTARRGNRKRGATLQEALGGVMRLKWWPGKGKNPSAPDLAGSAGNASLPSSRGNEERQGALAGQQESREDSGV